VSISAGADLCSGAQAFFVSHGNDSKIAKLNVLRPPPAYCALGGVACCGVRSERRGMAGTLRTPLNFSGTGHRSWSCYNDGGPPPSPSPPAPVKAPSSKRGFYFASGRNNSSGSLAIFAAIRRASSLGEQVGGIGRWVRPRMIPDIIGAVGPLETGAIPAKGARYEDVCVDHRAAFGGLAGRSAATATTGPWCRRPDQQFDPSKHRPYMY
jgi:hypothetical protein